MSLEKPDILSLYRDFIPKYGLDKEEIWEKSSRKFQDFWNNIIRNDVSDIKDEEIDRIVKILDSKGKGRTKTDVSVANVMVPQGAWYRLFRELKDHKKLGEQLDRLLKESEEQRVIQLVDELYSQNVQNKNYLTGPSANVINDLLFAYSPKRYISVVSLNDRRKIIEYFHFNNGPDFTKDSPGKKVVLSNRAIISGLKTLGIDGSPDCISSFLYEKLLPYWKPGVVTVKQGKSEISMSIPEDVDEDDVTTPSLHDKQKSKEIQALVCSIGERLGFKIWVPKNDRTRVLFFFGVKSYDSVSVSRTLPIAAATLSSSWHP